MSGLTSNTPEWVDHVVNALYDLLDLQALNDFIDRKLQASPIKSLIVYPEGGSPLHCIHHTATVHDF